MAQRKPWNQLSPAYRRRLERHGITKTEHNTGKTLRAARGHGITTPSSIRDAQKRIKKLDEMGGQHNKRVEDSLILQSEKMRIDDNDVRYALQMWPAAFTQTVLDYRRYRYAQWDKNHNQKYYDLITFQEYLKKLGIEAGPDWPLYEQDAQNTEYWFYYTA